MATEEQDDVRKLLKKYGIGRFEEALQDLGVGRVLDLEDVKDEDMNDMGFDKIQKYAFIKMMQDKEVQHARIGPQSEKNSSTSDVSNPLDTTIASDDLRHLLDKYNMGQYEDNLVKAGVTRVTELGLLRDEDIDGIGFGIFAKRAIRKMIVSATDMRSLSVSSSVLGACTQAAEAPKISCERPVDGEVHSSSYMQGSVPRTLDPNELKLAMENKARELGELDDFLESVKEDDRALVADTYELFQEGLEDEAITRILRSSISSQKLEWQRWMTLSRFMPSSISMALEYDLERFRSFLSLSSDLKEKLDAVRIKFILYGFDLDTDRRIDDTIIASIVRIRRIGASPDEIFAQAIEQNGQWCAHVEHADITRALNNSKDDFAIGERVQRRDKGKEWQFGYVTSVIPLQVTNIDDPNAYAFCWDEVRKAPLEESARSNDAGKTNEHSSVSEALVFKSDALDHNPAAAQQVHGFSTDRIRT